MKTRGVSTQRGLTKYAHYIDEGKRARISNLLGNNVYIRNVNKCHHREKSIIIT